MTSLYVHESGTPGAQAVVFIHAAAVSSWMWKRQTAHLSDYHCLSVDLPGHGKSNHVPWLSYPDTASKIAEVIERYAVDGKAHIVGLSLGGYVVQHVLSAYSNRLHSAVMSGTSIAPIPNSGMMLMMMRVMSFLLKTTPMIKMNAKMLKLPPEEYESYAENVRRMSRKAFVQINEETMGFIMPDNLRNVHTPTLIVAGENELALIKAHVQQLSETMPNAQGCIVSGVGHGWNGEAPDMFNEMLRAWFTDHLLPERLKAVGQVRV